MPESTEEDLKALAEMIKPDFEERMKIQRSPWLEDDVMEFEDIYKPLRIARKMGLPYDTGNDFVNDYKDIFASEEGQGGGKRPKRTRKKVILQGSPGMGKSTMVSKMVYDWATNAWKAFTLVFFISLKLVRPGEPIENIIVDEEINPVLYDEDFSTEMIRSILKNHGEKCLLIFDGLDELRHNEEIIKIIQDKKYRSCNILLTSRPHAVGPYVKLFFTQATISGFTEEVATHHITDMLREKEKAEAVLIFAKENQIVGFHEMWQNPMLLLFICIIVNDGNLDLTSKHLTLEEIYDSLHLCLYKRYLTRSSIKFEIDQWNQTMIKLGKMAHRGLENGELLYKISDIEKEVGKEAFHFGIIVGYKDRRLIKDLSADYWVCFLHRSIQEFLAARYIHNELHVSDRRPEDLWPGVWEYSTIYLVPLLFVFIVEMTKETSQAMQKLLTSCRNIFDKDSVTFYGNLIGRRVMEFLVKVLSTCHSIENITFQGSKLQDDENLIPELVHVMGPKFRGVSFMECLFVQGTTDSIKPFTRENGITVICEQSSVPDNSLLFLIDSCKCVHVLHFGAYHIKDSYDQKEVNLFYGSLIKLLSRPLPSLKLLCFEAEKNDPGDVESNDEYVHLHNAIIKSLKDGHDFIGNLPDLELLDLRWDNMPYELTDTILEATEGRARATLKELKISCMITNNLFHHCVFINSLFTTPFSNLETLTWNDRTRELQEDVYSEGSLEVLQGYHESMMEAFTGDDHEGYMRILPQHSVKGYFPKIEKVDFSVNGYMPRGATAILMEALNGSTTLKEFKLNTIFLPQF